MSSVFVETLSPRHPIQLLKFLVGTLICLGMFLPVESYLFGQGSLADYERMASLPTRMGWPVGPHYAEQSNVTNAGNLQGKLLLIVGELDRNVDPASTLQVVDALIRADKDFEFLLVPGGGHGVGSRKYGMRRTRDFFVRHLLGVEPRNE